MASARCPVAHPTRSPFLVSQHPQCNGPSRPLTSAHRASIPQPRALSLPPPPIHCRPRLLSHRQTALTPRHREPQRTHHPQLRVTAVSQLADHAVAVAAGSSALVASVGPDIALGPGVVAKVLDGLGEDALRLLATTVVVVPVCKRIKVLAAFCQPSCNRIVASLLSASYHLLSLPCQCCDVITGRETRPILHCMQHPGSPPSLSIFSAAESLTVSCSSSPVLAAPWRVQVSPILGFLGAGVLLNQLGCSRTGGAGGGLGAGHPVPPLLMGLEALPRPPQGARQVCLRSRPLAGAVHGFSPLGILKVFQGPLEPLGQEHGCIQHSARKNQGGQYCIALPCEAHGHEQGCG